MKKILLILATVIASTNFASAGSTVIQGRVVDIQPVYTNVRQQQPQEVCRNVEVPVYGTVQGQGANGGDVLAGMIIGGLLGKGATGQDNGAAAGAVIGGIIAAENGNNRQRVITGYRSERQCTTEYEYVNTRIINEYDITYNINGNQVTMRVNRVQGERAYVGQRKQFRVNYQALN
jgi:uncharacterized protein YcfJ